MAEERVSELEYCYIETSKTEKKKKEKRLGGGMVLGKTPRISENCGTTTKCVTCVMGTLEGEEREKGTEAVIEGTMTENFPKLMSDTKPQIQEAQRTTSRINAKQTNKKTNKLHLSISYSNSENQR